MLDLFCQNLDLDTLANLCDTGVSRDGSCPAADFLTESLQELKPIQQLLDVALIYANDTITTPLSHAEMMHKAFQKANYTDEMLAAECRKFEGEEGAKRELAESLHDMMVGAFQPSHWRLLTTQFPTAVLAAWLKANDARLQIPIPVHGVRHVAYHYPLRSMLLHEKHRVLKALEQAEPDCVRLLEVKISDEQFRLRHTHVEMAAMIQPVFGLHMIGQVSIRHDQANRRYVVTKRLAPTDFLRLSTATQTVP